jgi:hypothetical protein
MISFEQTFDEAFGDQQVSADYRQSLVILWQTGSEVLQGLYQTQTQDVIQACYEVSPRFCLHVVCVVYGVHWFLEQPQKTDKAYMTCVVLVLEGQWNQFKVLKQTFLNECAKQDINGQAILAATADYLATHHWLDADKLIQVKEILDASNENIALDQAYLDKCHLAVLATKQLQCEEMPAITTLTTAVIKQLIFHLNTYIGCPRVWDASIQFN